MAETSQSEYEFSPAHNTVMSEFSSAIVMVSIGTILLGSITILLGLGHVTRGTWQPLFEVGGGVVGLAIGFWLMNGAHALDLVVKTEGSDVTHLMSALAQLRRIFRLQALLMLVQALLLLLVVILSLR